MVRVRNLVLAIAAASALTSEAAFALGLGEVTLKSALNQPLVAEIELLDAKSLAPGEVVPVLASVEDFNRAGVDRQYFLTDLKFTPVLRPDGKSVIQVSSSKPVREPYLNFLVEVIWPSGRLLREYTLLLDPPLYSPETAAAVAPQLPVAVPAPRPAATPKAATSAPASRPAVPASVPASAQGGEYKTTANDTLWEIAERNRQGGTVHQTMLAIQDLNSSAFIDGNINRMKSGQVLRLPNAEQIASRSQSEAIQEVSRQNASWRQGTAGARQLDATQRSTAGAAPTRSETGDSLRLVAPEAGKSTDGSDAGTGSDEKALRDQLATAQESLDSSRRENADLQDRLGDLQGQLDKLQRLMQLKDDQLAKLQAQLANGVEAADDTPVAGMDEPGASATGDEAGEPAADEADQAAVETEPAAAAPAAEPNATPAPAPAAQPAAEPKKSAAPAAKPAPPVAPAPSEPDSFIKDLMGNSMLLAVIGGSALLLLLIGLMALSRRNAMKEAELQDSLLAESLPDNLYTAEVDSQVTAPAEDKADVRNDLATPRAANPIADTNSDPLAEADIYIAYGRFNQAAELLQNALNDEPQRSDLRLKLMEVYAELGNREGFAREEAELREIGGSSAGIDHLKLKYPAMAAAGFAAAAATSSSDDFDSFSLDDLALDEPAPAAPGQDMNEEAFDLSLDDLELDSPETPTAAGDSLSLDDLSFDDLASEPAAESQSAEAFSFELDEPAASNDVSLEDELADFSLDLDDEKPAASASAGLQLDEESATASADSLEDTGFEFDLPSETNEPEVALADEFDLSLGEEEVAEPQADSFSSRLEAVETELDELSRDLDTPVPTSADDSLDEMDEDFDFLSDTDETTTKLDLARAYIDMGDAEGARDILDEVISEGSDVQQQEAREMLAKLA
ncbi:FimV/HubP family polar landmark protein [Stutzerimonas nitrititolerans]|uniref:FimV/HubP family polar landmark protein n=1 Tax=Stutzerimonas nitrititolerans TaxID=2482751 RepID=UPI0028A5BBFE|nr:FimV/HubP family polar landmark protein [Stutzerimonas nitrititolerans]